MTQRELVLDIAMNLTRIGNWAADGYQPRHKRIMLFLKETQRMVRKLENLTLSDTFEPTWTRFLKAFSKLSRQGKTAPPDTLGWAEDMMTWGTILTHRASLV